MPDPSSPPQAFGADRRVEPREAVGLAARLVVRSGEALDVVIVDRSLRGMRIRLESDVFAPKEVSVAEIAAGVVHEATVVWKAQRDLGLSLKASHDIRTVSGPDADRLRRLWRQATTR